MKSRVLDSWSILEWILDRQPAREVVGTLLRKAGSESAHVLMSAINVGEVYHILRKHHAEELASRWRDLSGTLPVTIDVPTIHDVWEAASLKARYPIAYADAFAAALAQKHRCPLVTGDPEFRVIADLELDWVGKR